jgi:hypothetical protein
MRVGAFSMLACWSLVNFCLPNSCGLAAVAHPISFCRNAAKLASGKKYRLFSNLAEVSESVFPL